jgi:hypothetical protein
MPDKDYEIVLPSGAHIVVSIKMVGGRVVSFVVRLITHGGEAEYDAPVTTRRTANRISTCSAARAV